MDTLDTFGTRETQRRLLVFPHVVHPRGSLNDALSEHFATLIDDHQITGEYFIGDQFTIGQLILPDFRVPGGADLWGWSDFNALWRVPTWPADGSLPSVLIGTLQGWLKSPYGHIEYDTTSPAAVVTVNVRASVAPWGRCRCGHSHFDHDESCTQLITSTLGCGCLTWRPTY